MQSGERNESIQPVAVEAMEVWEMAREWSWLKGGVALGLLSASPS